MQEFQEDTQKAKKFIEDAIGAKVYGYRATSYSIMKHTLWALEILIKEGFTYDSSIFPIYHDRYGYPEFNRFPVKVSRPGVGEVTEIPLSTVRLLGRNIPIAGGGYLRFFPVWFMKWGLRRLNEMERQPAIIYLHPWELDTGQPRLNGNMLSLFRHYVNMKSTEGKLKDLLKTFRFAPIREVFS